MGLENQTISCSNCGHILRKSLSTNDIGKHIAITCLKCGTEYRIVVVDMLRAHDLMEQICPAAEKALRDSAEPCKLVQAMRETGLEINIFPAASIQPTDGQIRPIEPRVENGEVKLGTFTREDIEWLKKNAKIKFGD